eukprot:maker-scaffold360_size197209-snap-gene-0.44 protein:Tk00948 transcript:maker-scaffold360_size197209-snap-gene-0.44-mRNA-1 annotation:"thap domain-containing protein 2"
MVKCVVKECRNKLPNKKNISFHRFPVSRTRSAIWLRNIQRKGFKPSIHSCVCAAHFEERFFEPPAPFRKRRNLKQNAVPTIFNTVPESRPIRTRAGILRKTPSIHRKPPRGDPKLDLSPNQVVAHQKFSSRLDHGVYSISSPNQIISHREALNQEILALREEVISLRDKVQNRERVIKEIWKSGPNDREFKHRECAFCSKWFHPIQEEDLFASLPSLFPPDIPIDAE